MDNLALQVQTISSLKIAEMMETEHKEILRKIDGGTDRKGYAEILGENHLEPTNYFIKSTYVTMQNKEIAMKYGISE